MTPKDTQATREPRLNWEQKGFFYSFQITSLHFLVFPYESKWLGRLARRATENPITVTTEHESPEAAQIAIEDAAIKWLLDSLSTFDGGRLVDYLDGIVWDFQNNQEEWFLEDLVGNWQYFSAGSDG